MLVSGCVKFRIEELTRFQFMSVNLSWICHNPQEFELKWQEVEFSELQFKDI